MPNHFLPTYKEKIVVPPIKCQGIKTKLIKFIAESIRWNGNGRWIEPFFGSGVVLFNIAPKRALVGDTNEYIIRFYNALKNGLINEVIVKKFLREAGSELAEKGADYYYQLRDQFNRDGDLLTFLFLNRSGFNGIMRFNGSGNYNVPFGHKPERFRQAYITKIVNQVARVRKLIVENDWEFVVSDWKDLLRRCEQEDFVYMDPPYIGRHTDYYNGWTEEDAIQLAETANSLSCGFALSMWKENQYRVNEHLNKHWQGHVEKVYDHFYHVGSKEKFRNKMTEALIISNENVSDIKIKSQLAEKTDQQLSIFECVDRFD